MLVSLVSECIPGNPANALVKMSGRGLKQKHAKVITELGSTPLRSESKYASEPGYRVCVQAIAGAQRIEGIGIGRVGGQPR